ncbi:MAG: response regulator transcription factor [Magnetococcales bacterium]|nr:response regulator transcription factor [Magnetococcales bacterium]NGZ25922.1 response regulator transcription factor [Magnetococcales bacterium]
MTKTVLLVDDEKDLLSTLAFNLRKTGYTVRQAASGSQAMSELVRVPLPDLVILDLQLPDFSGLEVCRRIRADQRTKAMGILMLTAKGDEIDRVVGFEMGADDYMVKPFSVRELMLRIQALLRRTTPQLEEQQKQEIHFGLLRIDPDGCRVWVENNEVQLTALEFKLLTTLLERRGRLQTRDVLLNDVWGIHSYVQSRTVDVHIKRLREKLNSAGDYIETMRGMGYRFKDTP